MMTRKTKRTLTTAIAACLGFVLLLGSLSWIGGKTDGFTDVTIDKITQRDLNEDNLYTADALTIKENYTDGSGIKLTTKSDGRIILDGKLGGEDGKSIKVASVQLTAGTYTMTTDSTRVGQYSTYMYATADGGSTKLAFDFGGSNVDGVFEIAASGTYDLYIYVHPDITFDDVTFYPTIVAGDEAGAFYAED